MKLKLCDEERQRQDNPHHGNEREPQIGEIPPQNLELGAQNRPQIVVVEPDLEEAGVNFALDFIEGLLVGGRFEDQEHPNRGQHRDYDQSIDRR
jgi:hypothetical protein